MNNRQMTKYVALQKPGSERRFWQRTLLVFGLALVTVIIAFGVLYSRSLSLMSQNQLAATANTGVENVAAVAPAVLVTGTATTSDVNSENSTTEGGTWLFLDSGQSRSANPTAADRAAEQTNAPFPTNQLVPTVDQPSSEGGEAPELLRDLRLSIQALEEDEPRVAVELLLLLTQAHPDFRPAEVAQQLYLAYLALGDQAMRREARSEAIGYYEQAEQQAVADKTGLALRQAAIERYFPTTTGATVTADLVGNDATTPPRNGGAVAVAAPTATPVAPVQIEVAPAPDCPDNRIALSAPKVNALVQGSVAIVGSVTLEERWYYKLEWAPADSAAYAYFGGNTRSVANGVLGNLETRDLPNGATTIRVTVVDDTGNYPPPCEVAVVVAN